MAMINKQIRALARVDGNITENMSLHNMIGKGVLVITIAPKEGERYQGVISLDKPTITECLEDYFVRSEQLQTQLIIRTGEYEGKPVAAGMLLQIMPDGSGTPEDFEHLTTLAATVKDEANYLVSLQKSYSIVCIMKKPSIFIQHKMYNFSAAALQSVLVLHYCSSPMKKLTKY